MRRVHLLQRYFPAVICFAALIFIGWLGWWQFYSTVLRATPVKAALLNADRPSTTVKSGGGKTILAYEYEFNSFRYRGEQSTFGASWMGHNSSSDMQIQSEVYKLSRLIENRRMAFLKLPGAEQQNIEIQVWVDPRNPMDSALLARVHPGLAAITGFICLALLIGVIKPFVVSKNSLA
jgi:Protein of unknown function (DUF3592)